MVGDSKPTVSLSSPDKGSDLGPSHGPELPDSGKFSTELGPGAGPKHSPPVHTSGQGKQANPTAVLVTGAASEDKIARDTILTAVICLLFTLYCLPVFVP